MLNKLKFKYCLWRAARILQSIKAEYSPNGVVDDVIAGGDPAAPTTQESMAKVLSAYTKYLPGIFQATTAQIQPTEAAKLHAAQSVSPQYAALQNQLFSQYGPQLAATGAGIDASNRMAASQADLSVLQGPGQALIQQALGIDKQANPEFYAQRAQQASLQNQLLGSLDPTKLSGSEQSAIERGINASNVGGTQAPSNIGTVQNAMLYGGGLAAKQAQVGNALAQAQGFLQASRTGFDPIQIALGRPGINNAPQQQGVTKPGSEAFDLGGSTLNNLFNVRAQQNQINSQRRDSLDRVNETMSSIPNIS